MKEVSQKASLLSILTGVPFRKHTSLLLVLGTLLVSIPIIGDAYPHVFHPDEPGILKNSLKRFYQISQGDFYASLLLYEWLLVAWMGIGFLLGILFQFWSSFDGFRDALILETGPIIIWARLLSVILASLGHIILYHFFYSFSQNRLKLAWVALCLVFNPFFLPTLFWIKFDAIVYVFSSSLFVLSYRYLVLQEKNLQAYIYALGIFALAIRIETIVLPAVVFLHDLVTVIQRRKNVWSDPKLIRYGIIGLGFLFLVTLYPLTWLYSSFQHTSDTHLAYGETFGEKIIARIFSNTEQAHFSTLLWDSFSFFSTVLGLILGPLALGIFIARTYASAPIRYFALCIFLLLLVLTIFGVPFFRYSLLPSLIILGVSLVFLLKETSKFYQTLFLLHTLFLVSSGINYLLFKSFTIDPRLLAKEYVLEHTNASDPIAVETLSAKGFYPPFEECTQEMKEKSKLAKNLSPTGGYAYDIMLQKPVESLPCRKLIDICEVNYLSEIPSKSNRFVNTYDTLHLARYSPDLYISSRSPEIWFKHYYSFQSFYEYVLKEYPQVKEFSANSGIWDPRVKLMHARRSIWVYSKKGGS